LLFLYISVKFLDQSPKLPIDEFDESSIELFKDQLLKLGKLSWPEKVILADFCMLVFLWIFRADILIVGDTCVAWRGCLPGWSNLFRDPSYIRDSTVAILGAIVLFFHSC